MRGTVWISQCECARSDPARPLTARGPRVIKLAAGTETGGSSTKDVSNAISRNKGPFKWGGGGGVR